MTKNIQDNLNFLDRAGGGVAPPPGVVGSNNNNQYHDQAQHLLSFGRKQLLHRSLTADQKRELSIGIDAAVQKIVRHTFARPYDDPQRILGGVQIINTYVTKDHGLTPPYQLMHIKMVLLAIDALTGHVKAYAKDNPTLSKEDQTVQTLLIDEAYRFLQRLVTGTGIRARAVGGGYTSSAPTATPAAAAAIVVREAEFTKVLDAACTAGRLDLAQRVVTLQDRAVNAPPVSAIAYTILLRGYGDLGQLDEVDRVWQEALADENVVPDTIMMNSLLDAYINCGNINKAHAVFRRMKRGGAERGGASLAAAPPAPNLRSYNTMLKGWAGQGRLDQVQRLAREMQSSPLDLWDDVTVNTIVHAAVLDGDWTLARETLDYHAFDYDPAAAAAPARNDHRGNNRHPQVEAYTALLNGYSEAGMTEETLEIYALMNERNVPPTEVTFCCLFRTLGRQGDLAAATDAFNRMKAMDMIPSAKVYGALILGLLTETTMTITSFASSSSDDETRRKSRLAGALETLQRMIEARCYPPSTLIAVIIDYMAKGRNPQVQDVLRLVDALVSRNVLPHGDAVVWTALMKFHHAAVGDTVAALAAFQDIGTLDAVAVNVLLDICATNETYRSRVMDVFRRYFAPPLGTLTPTIVTYSAMMTALLSGPYSSKNFIEARKWYKTLKSAGSGKDSIAVDVDNTFVDVVLKLVLRAEVIRFLTKPDIYFIAAILTDAELLSWGSGQLERRQRVARAMLAPRLSILFNDENYLDTLLPSDSNDLFERKGWNRVESGFNVFGRPPPPSSLSNNNNNGRRRGRRSNDNTDRFLDDNGWNSVDSGFRLF